MRVALKLKMPHWGVAVKPEQATELGRRIINALRPTPALREWQEILEPLDFDTALRTFHAFRETSAHGLPIATFLERYQGQRPETTARQRGRPRPQCPACHGSGWVDGPPEYETIGGEPHEYTTLMPCPCTHSEPVAHHPSSSEREPTLDL